MLASITPLGERGRRSTWAVTVSAFLLGATAAGTGLGAVLGGAGELTLGRSGAGQERLTVLAAALALALILDLGSVSTPGPRRQVNERWLDEFRGWVYGLGFGAQLGLGAATVVSSAATYVAFLAAFLSASVGAGALVLGCYGLIRGLTPLAAAGVRRPEQLLALHARLGAWRTRARQLAIAALGVMVAIAAIGGVG